MKDEYEIVLNEFADQPDLTERLKNLLTDKISKEQREKIKLEIQCFEPRGSLCVLLLQ